MANPTAIGLIRVSTPDQLLGLEAQRADIARFAAERGIDVLSIVSEVCSGGADIDDRKGLAEATVAVARLGANHLIVAKRDRLARDPMVSMLTERSLSKLGATVLCADGNNSADANAELMRGMLDLFARWERRMISMRTKAALAALKAQGKSIGRPAGRKDDKPRKVRSDKGVTRGPLAEPRGPIAPGSNSPRWARISRTATPVS